MSDVALGFEGCYLRVVTDQLGRHLRADAVLPDPASAFERLDLSHGRVAFRTAEGRYLARHPDDDDRAPTPLIQLDEDFGPCAAFEELRWSSGQISLRTCDLHYVGVANDGSIVGDRISSGTWERFDYVVLPVAQVVTPADLGALVSAHLMEEPVEGTTVEETPRSLPH